ncbi:MAG: hypothetical protein PUH29_04155 [Lachnospiraceae bacterium]|nr:hypothetical protein [Lachnospiraceae bacterium]MDY5496707.1 hypothetical protein [Anaerobutyricum sp.]
MREGKNQKNNRKKGFTTVELTVVLTLVLILVGGIVVGLVKWINHLTFKRQNEYARTLYVAAQNQMTEYGESGQLSLLSEKTKDADNIDEKIESGEILGEQGQVYSLLSVWPESQNKGGNASRYQGEIVSVIATEQDYALYMKDKKEGTHLLEEDKTAMYDLVYSYLYDPSILKATVCVEFAPEEGQVFSVLYSDVKTGFTYGTEESGGRRGTASIRNRKADFRKKRLIGYYGVDTLSQATSTQVEKPSLSQVRLNNEETLNLTFLVKKALAAELSYEITINNKDSDRPVLSFTLDGSRLKNEGSRETIRCDVTRFLYKENGEVEKSTANFPVLAWMSAKQAVFGKSGPMLHVVLDAADLDATSGAFVSYMENYEKILGIQANTNLGGYVSGFAGTLSFHRFGVNTEDIFVTVKASGEFYKTSAKKQSNTENTYFDTYRTQQDGTKEEHTVYTLKNIRHLYNVRYIEDLGNDTSGTVLKQIYGRDMNRITYELTEDMDWESFQIESRALFQSGSEAGRKEIESFPSIALLRSGVVMKGTGEDNDTIRGLKITDQSGKAAGLFLCNKGTLSHFSLDNIIVSGQNNVGAFCGVNLGTLSDLMTKNTDKKSVIRGICNVGGIAGTSICEEETRILYKNLTNYARICGEEQDGENNKKAGTAQKKEKAGRVGGIVGSLSVTQQGGSILINDCRNFGQIRAMDEKVYGLGGIAGICNAERKDGAIVLSDCVSSPWYSREEREELLSEDENGKIEGLKGIGVGGIIGCNFQGTISHCSTQKEEDQEGYIFGDCYVGGIVGYCEKNQKGISLIDGGEEGINEAHVLGNSYVGGIVGFNPDGGMISGWKNKGFAAATTGYAGGITGYNAGAGEGSSCGEIKNCSSVVSNNQAVKELVATDLFLADFTGGIAGYNDGKIVCDKMTSVVSNITGNHFVGGVVGYNDMDGAINHIKVAGGYVKGTGSFIGGYAGFNASEKLLSEGTQAHYLESNPNQVEGNYCVGGTIGGNIVPAVCDVDTIFYSDNFLGKVKAKGGIAGGFIGYNQLIEGDKFKKNYKDKLLRSVCKLAAGFDEEKNLSALADLEKYIQNYLAPFLIHGSAERSFVIRGKEKGTETKEKFGEISSRIYVGGVLGYSAEGTRLTVKNVVNYTPVRATQSVENEKEQDERKDYEGKAFVYSYAGGIIGRVNEDTVIDSCKNQDAGDVTGEGTYTGGICEINEGQIINCRVSSLGLRTMDYVGGIAGLNKKEGKVQDCIFGSKTVTGHNYVGGIVSENFGTISGTRITGGKVRAFGTVGRVGGIAAVNEKEKSAKIILGTEEMDARIESEGNCAGIVSGINYGMLVNESYSENGTGTVIHGSVRADSYAGGVIGANETRKPVSGYCNYAQIKAVNGYAGGIAASTRGNIADCENYGKISAQKQGDAGGIVAENKENCVISGCRNAGGISAQHGLCGGISGINMENAQITDCKVGGENTFESREKAGGICGVNRGEISSSEVKDILVCNLNDSKESMLGGIAGENEQTGVINDCYVGISFGKIRQENTGKVRVKSYASKVHAGGVTGQNFGTVQGRSEKSVVNAELSFTAQVQTYFGNLGGIVGTNHAVIKNYIFRGNVLGTGNDPRNAPQYDPNNDGESSGAVIYGYGGIAGVNRMKTAVIENCRIEQAEITGLGDANNVVNLGGICGVNEKGAVIFLVSFGSGEKKFHPHFDSENSPAQGQTVTKTGWRTENYVGTGDSRNAYGHTGGVAGLNSGTIKDVDETSVNHASLLVENYRGHVGGIVGYNRRTGKVDCVETGKDWLVFAPQSAQDNGCGGIIGYQAGENGISDCLNRATVVKTAASSNGVGGLIGRMEVATAQNYLIKNCINFGKIDANRRSGGMIGVWKYYGGNISDCVNYGPIITRKGEGCAGMVACFYGEGKEVNIFRCENHGKIWDAAGGACGGIVGYSQDKELNLHLRDCVNTGLIKAGESNSGICAIDSNLSSKTTITGCKNYGYAFSGKSDQLSGILPPNVTKGTTVENCFNFTDIHYPITKQKEVVQQNNFYLSRESVRDGNSASDFYVKKIEAPNITRSEYLYKTVMDPDSYSEADRAYFDFSRSGQSYTFTFSCPLELNSMDLYWNRGNDQRVQNYDVYYKTKEDAQDWILYQTVDNITSPNREEIVKNAREVVSGGIVTAAAVKIVITGSVKQGTVNGQAFHTNACLCRIKWNGSVDGEEVTGYQGIQRKENEKAYDLSEGLSYQKSDSVCTFSKTEIVTEKGIGSALNQIKNEDGSYRLITNGNVQIGRLGYPEDMLLLWNMPEAKEDSSLKLCGDARDNLRYFIFTKDNPYISEDSTQLAEERPERPENVKITEKDGALCNVSWSIVEKATYYEYEMIYKDEEGKQIKARRDIVYDNSVVLPVGDTGEREVTSMEVRIRAGRDALNQGESYRLWSGWSVPAVLDRLMPILPKPKFHLELILKDGVLQYEAILDNREEYRTFLVQNKVSEKEINIKLSKIWITIRQNNTERFKFSVADGKSGNTYKGENSISNTMIKSSASSETNEYRTSAEVSRETMISAHSLLAGDKPVALVHLANEENPQVVGFHGDTAENLNYQVEIKYNSEYRFNCYIKSEFVIQDQELGIPVSVATSKLRVSDTTSDYIVTKLSPLPEDLSDENVYQNCLIRSYPSLFSNNVVYNGHTARTGMTKEELQRKWYVTKDHYLTEENTGELLIQDGENGKKKLSDGFDIEQNSDGTYTVSYNALLEYACRNSGEDSDSASRTLRNGQVFTCRLLENKKVQNAPVIHVNDTEKNGTDGDPNKDDLMISWDLNNSFYLSEGKTAVNYKEGAVYDYIVTGTTEDGVSVLVDSGTYTTKKGEDNQLLYHTENWNYRNLSIKITRQGEVNLYGITNVFPRSSRKEISLKERLSQVAKPEIGLHQKENGQVEKDDLLYDVTWNSIPEDQRSALSGYEITVKSTQREYIQKWNVPITESDREKNVLTHTITLEAFDREENILIFVRALACGDRYQDSVVGVEAEMTLPARLYVPDVSGLTVEESMEYDKENFVTKKRLEQGISLNYTGQEPSTGIRSQYQLAAAIFDKKQENGRGKEEKDRWNQGALYILSTKEAPQEMVNDDETATALLKNEKLKEYGGKWLKIVMRSVSEQAVSSYWSDEDADGQTLNYCWIRIPRIQVDGILIPKGTKMLYYNEEGEPGEEGETSLPITQTALSFDLVSHADGYRIQIIRKGNDTITMNDNKASVRYADFITLYEKEDGYDVMFVTSDPNAGNSQMNWSDTNPSNGGEGHLLGRLKKGENLFLPITGKVSEFGANQNSVIDVISCLMLEEKEGHMCVKLILPDAEEISGLSEESGNHKYLFTDQVTIRPLVTREEEREGYETGQITDWYRKNETETGQIRMSAYGKMPEAGTVALVNSDRENVRYELKCSASNWLIYEVRIKNKAGQTIVQKLVSTYGYGTSTIHTTALLPKSFSIPENGTMEIRTAAFLDVGNGSGGISQWDTENNSWTVLGDAR